jgi:hypothetical protein
VLQGCGGGVDSRSPRGVWPAESCCRQRLLPRAVAPGLRCWPRTSPKTPPTTTPRTSLLRRLWLSSDRQRRRSGPPSCAGVGELTKSWRRIFGRILAILPQLLGSGKGSRWRPKVWYLLALCRAGPLERRPRRTTKGRGLQRRRPRRRRTAGRHQRLASL